MPNIQNTVFPFTESSELCIMEWIESITLEYIHVGRGFIAGLADSWTEFDLFVMVSQLNYYYYYYSAIQE